MSWHSPVMEANYTVLRFTFPYHVSRCRHGRHISGALVSSSPGIIGIGNGLAVTNCTVTASLWQPCHVACVKRVTCIRVSSWIIVTCGGNNLSQGMFRVDFNKVFKGNASFKKWPLNLRWISNKIIIKTHNYFFLWQCFFNNLIRQPSSLPKL